MYGKHLGKPLQPLTLTTKQARFPGAYAVAVLSPNIGAIKIRLVVFFLGVMLYYRLIYTGSTKLRTLRNSVANASVHTLP